MTNAAPADRAATEPTSRRALLGAGVIGAALAVAGSREASAAAPQPSNDDVIAELAIGYELAARDLYDAAIAAGASDELWYVMREQHESYAQRVSGIVGVSANRPDVALFESLSGQFADSGPVEVARNLENTLSATHTAWLAVAVDLDIASAMASIAAMEARHAAVLGLQAGMALDDELFTNSADALTEEA